MAALAAAPAASLTFIRPRILKTGCKAATNVSTPSLVFLKLAACCPIASVTWYIQVNQDALQKYSRVIFSLPVNRWAVNRGRL